MRVDDVRGVTRARPYLTASSEMLRACREVREFLKLLYVKREMNFNEVRLTIAIEDPRAADRRERYGREGGFAPPTCGRNRTAHTYVECERHRRSVFSTGLKDERG